MSESLNYQPRQGKYQRNDQPRQNSDLQNHQNQLQDRNQRQNNQNQKGQSRGYNNMIQGEGKVPSKPRLPKKQKLTPIFFHNYTTTNVHELKSGDFKRGKNEIFCTHPKFEGKCGLIMFYASWCEYSKAMVKPWSAVALTGGDAFPFGAVNCENQRGVAHALKIKGYPTFKVVYPDGVMKTYNGPRDTYHFVELMCHLSRIDTTSNNRRFGDFT